MIERHHFYVGGQWVDPLGDQISEVVNPATAEVAGRVPIGSAADIDRAVAAARDAFDNGPWRKMSWSERIAILAQVGKAMNERADEIAEYTAVQSGRDPNASTARVRNPYSILYHHYLDTAESLPLQEIRRSPANPALIVREPIGVVAAITPFNAPLACAVNKTLPAMLAGCTVVVKPPPEAPLDTYVLADAIHSVGLPDGVFNMVAAGREEGAHLVAHPDVDMVTFTGSVPAGKAIGEACAHQVKRVTLELGGKSAGIVLEDADLHQTIPLLTGIFHSVGQACFSLTRVLASRSRYEEVVQRLGTAATALAGTTGPLVSAAARDRVEGYIRSAIDDGCRLVAGGTRREGAAGFYIEPTVLADVDNSMRVAREEIFGPVVCVIPYDTVDDAIRIANDSPFGLSGAVFTSDERKGVAILREVRAGFVAVNGFGSHLTAPMGGMKESGLGREHGPEGFSEFLEYKSITISAELAAQLEAEGDADR